MPYEITTQMMKLGDMDFEVDVCGDPASEKLALLLHGFPKPPTPGAIKCHYWPN